MGNHPIQNPALNLASDIGKQKKARMLKDAKGCLDNQTLREVLSVLYEDMQLHRVNSSQAGSNSWGGWKQILGAPEGTLYKAVYKLYIDKLQQLG
jgi:hypothetical protein